MSYIFGGYLRMKWRMQQTLTRRKRQPPKNWENGLSLEYCSGDAFIKKATTLQIMKSAFTSFETMWFRSLIYLQHQLDLDLGRVGPGPAVLNSWTRDRPG
ncbi:unnamed protein product [Cuscuta europaea]|uniref:Uncharacterized protein n=1 Tax=Cuscuta europaea TaxID=41803 RepID=A0A9P0ZI07_CUSEU|nr:unnamed protein product [Cuscuta europaea]